jgi:hypothetical protein
MIALYGKRAGDSGIACFDLPIKAVSFLMQPFRR